MQKNKFVHEDIWSVCNSAAKKLVAMGLVAVAGCSSVVNRNVLVSAQSIGTPNNTEDNGSNQNPNNGNEALNNNQQQRPRLTLSLTPEEQEYFRFLQNGQHQDLRNNGNGSTQIPNNGEHNNNQQQRPGFTFELTSETREQLRSLQSGPRQDFRLQFDPSLVQWHMNMPDAPIRNNSMMQEETQNNPTTAPTMAATENHDDEVIIEEVIEEADERDTDYNVDYMDGGFNQYAADLPTLNLPLPTDGTIINIKNDLLVIPTNNGPVLLCEDPNLILTVRGQSNVLLEGRCARLRRGLPIRLHRLNVAVGKNIQDTLLYLNEARRGQPLGRNNYNDRMPDDEIKELEQAQQGGEAWPFPNAEDDSYFGLDKDLIDSLTKKVKVARSQRGRQMRVRRGANHFLLIHYPGSINIGNGLVQIGSWYFERDYDQYALRDITSNDINVIARDGAIIVPDGRSAVIRRGANFGVLGARENNGLFEADYHSPLYDFHRCNIVVGNRLTDTLFSTANQWFLRINEEINLCSDTLDRLERLERARAQQLVDHENGVITAGKEVPIVYSLSSYVNQIEGTGTTIFDQGDIVVGGFTDDQQTDDQQTNDPPKRDVTVNEANKVSVREGITMELGDNAQFKMGGSLKETMDNVLDAISERKDTKNMLEQITTQAAQMEIENEDTHDGNSFDSPNKKSEYEKKPRSIIRRIGGFVFRRILNYSNPRIQRMMAYAAKELGLSGQAIIDFVERFFIQGG